MADIYVRSTDGLDADSGATWALAKATLVGAAAIDAAGDRIFLSDNQAESTAAAVSVVLAGSLVSKTQLLSVDDSTGEPPTALLKGASVTTTGANAISVEGYAYIHGVAFNCGT